MLAKVNVFFSGFEKAILVDYFVYQQSAGQLDFWSLTFVFFVAVLLRFVSSLII